MQFYQQSRPPTRTRNQSQELFSQLISQINEYQRQPIRPPTRQRTLMPMPRKQSEHYDVGDPIFERLFPQRPVDEKFRFIKLREQALRKPSTATGRRRILTIDETLIPKLYTEKKIEAKPLTQLLQATKSDSEQKVDRKHYLNNSYNFLKSMQQDNRKLVNCSFN